MFLSDFFRALYNQARRFYDENLSFQSPSDRMRRRLRIMYGQREIDKDAFLKLRHKLDEGYFIEGDLTYLHRQAEQRVAMGELPGRPAVSPDMEYIIDQLYLNRAVIEESREEVQSALRLLIDNRAWLVKQREEARQREAKRLEVLGQEKAAALESGSGTRKSLPDSGTAKTSITTLESEASRIFGIKPPKLVGQPIRIGLKDHIELLDQRINAAYQELHRLDWLEEQLRMYEFELLLAQTSHQTALTENMISRQINYPH